jgi:hypothetical protein
MKNELAFFIWRFEAQVLNKRKAKSSLKPKKYGKMNYKLNMWYS